jgi:tRNA U54 and U55 pseudouridine synthase Pus10
MESYFCQQCCRFLDYDFDDAASESVSKFTCPICLDLFRADEDLVERLRQACDPYGGVKGNRFVTQAPNILLPGDVSLRYRIASMGRNGAPFSKFQSSLKDHLRNVIADYVEDNQKSINSFAEYPDCIAKEEQGFLAAHLLVAPVKDISRPPIPFIIKPKQNNRKRFRGNDPTEKQGGHPIVNKQQRLIRDGYDFWTLSEVEMSWSKASKEVKQSLAMWFNNLDKDKPGSQLHVIVCRQPLYVRALYTKARRDVSQTPFYVPDKDEQGKTVMKRLGVTSVEEQIVPSILKSIGGVSKLNNNADIDDIVYGMVKFHASGREDMNVRMTLPPDLTDNVGGRPFVLEIIDALRLPTVNQLRAVVSEINHTGPDDPTEIVSSDGRTYGRNPFGVGISSCLRFVPGNSFRTLQSDTEEKVKYYGCDCWSEARIPSSDYLNERLAVCPIVLRQRTPVRVLHRRPNFARTRHILSLKATKVDEHNFRLNISTDAGTYVKEFVHGDLGRTVPSVSSLLGCKTDIPVLDCEGIQQC